MYEKTFRTVMMISLVRGIDQEGSKVLILSYYLAFISTLDGHLTGQPDFVELPILRKPFDNSMQGEG